MQSTPTLKEADPHDVFAIETVLAAHAHKAPPLAHDPATPPVAPQVHPAAPQVHVAPQVEVAATPQVQAAATPQVQAAAKPQIHVAPAISVSAPTPQVEPTFRATDLRDVQMRDVEVDNIRPGEEIKLDGLKLAGERPVAIWVKRAVMALLALVGAIAAAGWQHYGDQAKAMAAEWAPPFVLAALPSAAKPAVAEQPPAAPAAATDQAAAEPAATAAPAQSEPAATAAAAPSAESTQLQSMAQDLAAMGQQVEELKATIAQLKASQAQMAREFAKAGEMKASEARAAEIRPEQNFRPRVTAAPPPPRTANAPVAPVRKPKPAYYPPAQAAYVPPPPPAAGTAPLPPASPQQTMADDGEPVVRPPMPLR
ncbi:hypothetical protein IVA95_16505 [Bradyrhizobium sp. 157]|uniref:hypothetical protein n=1 Tax=Bradyrhizobium sp. 157 TaxID=2782631 RepID=UPI001FF73039|nr:hypothetical protein [Bradyrhizobium sp. 157]MCK1639161.1 hypothetical protein [Bradyrhizobium sp. 157]